MLRVRLSERFDPLYEKMAWPPVAVFDVSVPRPAADLPWRAAAIRYAGAHDPLDGAEVIDLVGRRGAGNGPRTPAEAAA